MLRHQHLCPFGLNQECFVHFKSSQTLFLLDVGIIFLWHDPEHRSMISQNIIDFQILETFVSCCIKARINIMSFIHNDIYIYISRSYHLVRSRDGFKNRQNEQIVKIN